MLSKRAVVFLALLCLCPWPVMPAAAEPPLTAWQATKCRVYAEALQNILDGGEEDFSSSFLAENEAFVAAGCVEPVAVCPRSQADLDAANLLTIAAMNAGAASTFLPFACVDG